MCNDTLDIIFDNMTLPEELSFFSSFELNLFHIFGIILFTGLLFTSFSSTVALGFVAFIVGRVSPPPQMIPNSMKIRIPRCSIAKIGAVYALTGIFLTLSLDQNRVLCHVQDPVKAITLFFSLVYYFFFCRKSE